MRYSRLGIVAVLIGIEVFVAAVIIFTVGGLRPGFASSTARRRYVPSVVSPLDAGARPNVVVDDADSRVVVTPSTDGKVHVTDATRASGWEWGWSPPSHVSMVRTADGVLIRRPTSVFGTSGYSTVTEVAMPPGGRLDIRDAGSAEVSDLQGAVRVRCNDGRIDASSLSGGADLSTADGRIEATGIRGDRLSIATDDGSVGLDDVAVGVLDGSTADGSIGASQMQIRGGKLSTDDGSIRIAFTGTPNLMLHARTMDGSISIDGQNKAGDGSSVDYRLGNGAGSLDLSTQDGSIRILTNGAR